MDKSAESKGRSEWQLKLEKILKEHDVFPSWSLTTALKQHAEEAVKEENELLTRIHGETIHKLVSDGHELRKEISSLKAQLEHRERQLKFALDPSDSGKGMVGQGYCQIIKDLEQRLAEWETNYQDPKSYINKLEGEIQDLERQLKEAEEIIKTGLETHGEPCHKDDACPFIKQAKRFLNRKEAGNG